MYVVEVFTVGADVSESENLREKQKCRTSKELPEWIQL